MNITALIINTMAIFGLLIAFAKDKDKAIQSLKIAGKSFIRVLPMVFIIIIVIGLLLGFVPPEQISGFIGEQSGIKGILLVGVLGALMHIPALLSFPLAASLLENGASVSAVVAFITTLTMIGTVTLPLEIKELGKRIAFLRNGLSFIIAIIIALIMGAIL
ncbi:permease [Thermococcus argininiproducens]|uniref:Permease n=1 Tax=Thermococcus argininiproducens TaxID=2866384 RepID=A0A9E7M968_9EURY|nr:permease [Thermococcus argininiproducens]USG99239.1 permease [Thermococcus argininiproducens]